MAFEQFKTQVLLLHSEQSTLDRLSAGFNDRYSVHCATSGTEALTTLGDTPIHFIVSAQELPGMSGLEALREAKKRSPETVGILLAGKDTSDGLEALVSEKEVFQIVRGSIAPEALLQLIESATKQARLMALAESANDKVANVDEPVSEHIVMETSPNGSTIISDGTGQMPALKPHKVDLAPGLGAAEVDVLVLTKDEEFLETIKDSARGLHNIHHALTPTQADEYVRKNRIGVLVTDAAMVGSQVESLTAKLRKDCPRIVAIVAGRRDDGEMLMDLINRGHVYRFLLKPVSPGRARLAIEASVKHHLEAPDAAFKPKAGPPPAPAAKKEPPKAPPPKAEVKPAPKAEPKSPPKPAQKAKEAPKPQAPKPESKPEPKPTPQPAAKAKPAPEKANKKASPVADSPKPVAKKADKPAPTATPARTEKIEPTFSDEPLVVDDARGAHNDLLPETAFDLDMDDGGSFTETIAGAAASVTESIASASESVKDGASRVSGSVGEHAASIFNPRNIGIGAGALAAVAVVAWFVLREESPTLPSTANENAALPAPATDPAPSREAPVESPAESTIAAPVAETEALAESIEAPEPPAWAAQLDEARAARDSGNILVSNDANAVELYLDVVDSSDGDPEVVQEFNAVIADVLAAAESAMLNRDMETVSNALSTVRFADPDNARLPFLEAQMAELNLRDVADQARLAMRENRFDEASALIIDAENLTGTDNVTVRLLTEELAAAREQARIAEVLAMAADRAESGSLIAPADDSARYYYQLVLAGDANNIAARQGLVAVASKLALRAREAIDAGQLDEAESLLAEARLLDPDSSELAAATRTLVEEREAIAEAARQAEAARLAEIARQEEERRQAELARQAELERQAELARQAELERQAELARQAEAERLAAERRAEAERLAEIERLAELERQAEAARLEAERRAEAERLAEIERLAELERQARAAEAARIEAERQANAAATASPLGVGARRPAQRPAPRPSNTQPATSTSSGSSAPSRTAAPTVVAPAPETRTATAGVSTFGTNGNVTSAAPSTPPVAQAAQIQTPPASQPASNTSGNAGATTKLPEMVAISTLNRTNFVPPEYPRSAARRNITGAVSLLFTVSTTGSVENVSVTNSEPGDTFNQAAIDAVMQWRFEPVVENGVPVEKRSGVRLTFDLN